jgi:CRISPR-associated protein Csm3
MLKAKLCEAVFHWNLTCDGPLLIRDERYSKYQGDQSKGYPSNLFMSHASELEIKNIAGSCANSPPTSLNFYVPGTSLRGPFRALAERILRSLMPANAPPHLTACDPFEQNAEERAQTLGCSKRLEREAVPSMYAGACPICKLFGCAGLAARIRFTDAEIPPGSYSSVYRDMIGIDRFTGGVSNGANMRFHVLEKTSFSTKVTVTNFELWHLGLLAYVLRDFEQGLVSIGFGKSKGFGQVKATVKKVVFSYLKETSKLDHLGSLITDADQRIRYSLHVYDAPGIHYSSAPLSEGLSLYRHFEITDHQDLFKKSADAFNDYMEKVALKAGESIP